MNYVQKLSLALIAFALTACDSDSTTFVSTPPPETFDLQILHASPDAPAVDVVVNGSAALENVDYKVGSGRLELDVGTYSVAVEGILPGGNTPVIGPVDLTFDADTIYSVVAVNDVANIEPVIVTQPRTAVSASSARLHVLHAAAAAPQVDVYVTAPDADLAASPTVGSFAFKETIGPAEVAAGEYQIRVTLAGDPDSVVYDSGTRTLNDGDDLFIAAVPTAAPASTFTASPISLVILTGTDSVEYLDAGANAALRAFHASPDAPDVDIVVNDNFAAPLVEDFTFSQVAGYVPVGPASYNVKVVPANPQNAVIKRDVTLAAGEVYDVLAVGLLASIEPLILNDDPRVVNTHAKVRIIHASPAAQNVDIYVAAPGTDISTITPAFEDIPFKGSTGYVGLPADADGETYEVTVVATGTTTPAIGPAEFTFFNGDVVTVVARDAAGGGAPLDVIVTNDAPAL